MRAALSAGSATVPHEGCSIGSAIAGGIENAGNRGRSEFLWTAGRYWGLPCFPLGCGRGARSGAAFWQSRLPSPGRLLIHPLNRSVPGSGGSWRLESRRLHIDYRKAAVPHGGSQVTRLAAIGRPAAQTPRDPVRDRPAWISIRGGPVGLCGIR